MLAWLGSNFQPELGLLALFIHEYQREMQPTDRPSERATSVRGFVKENKQTVELTTVFSPMVLQ